jgi:hypothetical protein
VKFTEAGGPNGFDTCRKIKGRKRHALVDTDGRGLELQARANSAQDRDGAVPVLQASRDKYPPHSECICRQRLSYAILLA